ncbi:prominin-2 isoform X1 [Acipenser ruthenus]|uniref:prominin-2 isoform X1 n=2 Tax=Acipenser ruthenus TaxID=7906 RepID=UPI002741DB83|nr:prominin-2 isoform X1 [Acipenser ruthenus]XP_058841402.1 prominin-2 isoform X1 [Acipenser ruthenus]
MAMKTTLLFVLLGCCGVWAASGACSSRSLELNNLNQSHYKPDPSRDTGITVLSDMVHSFLGMVQPNPFPTELLTEAIKDVSTIIQEDSLRMVLKYEAGFLVCAAIGILFILLMPLIGFFFCCCRCCGNCGGRMYQKQSKKTSCKRRGLYWSLMLITIVILAGNICMFISNDKFTKAINNSTELLNDTLDNMKTFLSEIPQQINAVVKESSKPLDEVSRSLNDIGPLLGGEILQALGGPMYSALDSLLLVSQEVTSIGEELMSVNSTTEHLKQKQQEIVKNLTAIRNRIEQTLKNPNCSGCDLSVGSLDKLTVHVDFSGMPDLSSPMDAISKVKDANLSAIVNEANKTLNSIPERVSNETRGVVADVKKQLKGIEEQIGQIAQNIPLDQLTDVTKQLDTVMGDLHTYLPGVSQADKYRWIAGLILSCLVLLAVVCNSLGLLLGPAGLRPSADPTERSCTADCGGVFFMAGVGFSFLYSWLLMLLVLLMFLLGGNVYTLVCKPWSNQQLLKFIDTPGVIKGFNLSHMLGVNTHLEISQIYSDCKNNDPIWSTLHLEDLVNLDELLNISKYTGDIQAAFDNTSIQLPEINLLNNDSLSLLQDFSSSGIHGINFTAIEQQVNQNLTSPDIDSFADRLDQLAVNQNQTIKGELMAEAADLRNLSRHIPGELQPQVETLKNSVEPLKVSIAQIPITINATLAKVKEAQKVLNTNTSEIIKKESQEFLNCQIGYFETYADWAKQTITQKVACCKPAANAIDAVEIIACAYIVDSLNAFWFSMGWCLMFLLPSIILSVKLAKFYRRMKYMDVYEDSIPMFSIPRAAMKS